MKLRHPTLIAAAAALAAGLIRLWHGTLRIRLALGGPERPTGPLLLQCDHGPVAFRNLRVKPLKSE